MSTHVTHKQLLNERQMSYIYILLFFFSIVRQNQFDKLCNSERGWAFERVINGALEGYDHKKLDSIETRAECARLCLLVSDEQCDRIARMLVQYFAV